MTHLGIFHLVLYNPPPPGSPASNFDIPAGIPVTFTIPSRTRNFHQYPKKKGVRRLFSKKVQYIDKTFFPKPRSLSDFYLLKNS